VLLYGCQIRNMIYGQLILGSRNGEMWSFTPGKVTLLPGPCQVFRPRILKIWTVEEKLDTFVSMLRGISFLTNNLYLSFKIRTLFQVWYSMLSTIWAQSVIKKALQLLYNKPLIYFNYCSCNMVPTTPNVRLLELVLLLCAAVSVKWARPEAVR
jgi:hypothetical protein